MLGWLRFLLAFAAASDVAALKSGCAAVPAALVSTLQKYALTHDNEEGGAFSVRGGSFESYKILPGAKTGYVFSAPPWPAPAMFHVHPVTSYFLPSAADFDAVLREAVAYELNKDYNFCAAGQVCSYKNTDVCDSFLGTQREAVFAPNGVYVYGPSEALTKKVAASDDPEALVESIKIKIGPFDCDDCWPKCGRRKCHFHPWTRGKGNYNDELVGQIQPFADCGDGKPEHCIIPSSAQTLESHAKYIEFLRNVGGKGVGFDLDFYPYGSQVCLGVRGSSDASLDPFSPMCKPEPTPVSAVSTSAHSRLSLRATIRRGPPPMPMPAGNVSAQGVLI